MVAGYILMNTKPGALKEAAKKIAGIEGVREVDAITGPYDAIAYAEAATPDQLGRLVVSAIQQVPGVEKTLTCLVVALEEKAAA
jgi:DNA-binding Lrp family transcriptional regulator